MRRSFIVMTDQSQEREPASETKRTRWRMRNVLPLIILLILVLVGLLLPMPFHGPWVDPLADLAHAPLFCSLVLGTLGFLSTVFPIGAESQLDRRKVILFRAIVVVTALTFFGIAMEFLQRSVGRNASWGDVWANTLGAIAGVLGFYGLEDLRYSARVFNASVFLLGAVLLLLWASWDPAITLYHYWNSQ